MKVWVLQTGEPLPLDGESGRPMRAINLTKKLLELGHSVVLWSSDFNHFTHDHRYGRNMKLTAGENLEVRLIHSRGYQRNVSPQRLFDHAGMARVLKNALKRESPPDVALVGFPPIETAAVMMNWLCAMGVPAIVDVKDQWPEVLLRAIPEPMWPIGRLALRPYYRSSQRALSRATAITSISESFLKWSLEVADRPPNHHDGVFPLTTPSPVVSRIERDSAGSWWDGLGVFNDGRNRACFVGTLGSAFDFHPIAEAARNESTQFVICGTGSEEVRVRELFHGLPNVVMPGWVDVPQAVVLAERSTMSLGPYLRHDDFMESLPNKFIDSLSRGLPFVTSLEGEVGRVCREFGVGLTYDPISSGDLARVVSEINTSPDLRQSMASAAMKVYDEFFNFDKVYSSLVERLEAIAKLK